MAKKEKEQKPMLNLDGTEYDIESMSDEQKAMTNHIADLSRKIDTMQFNMQQLQFGKSAFVNALKESLEKKEEEAQASSFTKGEKMPDQWVELGFAGLSATILFMTFKWMTNELNKKIDDLHEIIIKLIDAKNVMVDKFQDLNDEITDQLNYIEASIGNGRGSKQRRKSGK